MKVSIRTNQVEIDKAIEAHIQRKLMLALSRIESYITAISITLSDVVGEADVIANNDVSAIRCCIQISITKLQVLEIEDTQTDLYYAIDRVIQKASRIAVRKLISVGINVPK